MFGATKMIPTSRLVMDPTRKRMRESKEKLKTKVLLFV